MRDFYTSSLPMPLDQADGLRRLFAGRSSGGQRVLPLVANPHVGFCGVVLDRLAAVLASHGRRVLVVDAATRSPAPGELAQLDLAAAIEQLSPRVSYLPARGLPLAHVDTRGSAAGFLDAIAQAAPQADAVLLHADPADMARMFMRRGARPLLIGADHPESIKHAYAAAKLLVGRCGLMTFDLLLAAPPQSPRLAGITTSLASCVDTFLGALLHDWALVDPAADPGAPADDDLSRLLAGQLRLDDSPAAPHSIPSHGSTSFTNRPALSRQG